MSDSKFIINCVIIIQILLLAISVHSQTKNVHNTLKEITESEDKLSLTLGCYIHIKTAPQFSCNFSLN
jgi:hypothetical protein